VELYQVCSTCFINRGDGGYIYSSVVDSLRENGYSLKENVNIVMSIGNMISLSKEEFSKEMPISITDLKGVFNGNT